MPTKRFVILAASRTGSSHLREYLSRHEEVRCFGELLSNHSAVPEGVGRRKVEKATLLHDVAGLTRSDPIKALEQIYSRETKKPIVGFKMLSKHAPPVMACVLADNGVTKILLYRANALARYASLLASRETKTWNATPERPKLTFDPADFRKSTAGYVGFYRKTLATLNERRQPYFLIRNDELDSELRLEQLLFFLGAQGPTPPLEGSRVRSRGASDIAGRFANSGDVFDYLKENDLMHWAYEGDAFA
ncbi:MAG TPA: hypothetical protein VIM02_11740 [Rhizomicrobium sp.]|jgi:hypothetical protein